MPDNHVQYNDMKLLITGGHLAPALAIIDEILQNESKTFDKIIFVGRKYSLDTEKNLSLEYREITKRGLEFIPLNAGRLTRILSVRSIRSLVKVPIGFFNAWSILRKEKPDSILSFGGYLALPIAFWSLFFGIPIYTHEQTVSPGLTNRIIGFFSKKIFLAFEESALYFNRNKTIVTGNPVRKSIFITDKKPFSCQKDRMVLYITGGSLGSHSINVHISRILQDLLQTFIVIHQIGDTKEYHDYDKLWKQKLELPPDAQNRYFLTKHFFEDEIGYVYSLADIVIGRSGANTFFELIALKKPAVLIPLPWSAHGEQKKHAELFKEKGIGEIFFQNGSSDTLLRMIHSMAKNLETYKKNFSNVEYLYNQYASEKIIEEISPHH